MTEAAGETNPAYVDSLLLVVVLTVTQCNSVCVWEGGVSVCMEQIGEASKQMSVGYFLMPQFNSLPKLLPSSTLWAGMTSDRNPSPSLKSTQSVAEVM